MKILFIADQHYLLKKKGVKSVWLRNRINLFHHEINFLIETERPDIIILGGDLFDHSPSIAEVGLFLDFLAMTKISNVPVYMIAGNHEASTKYETFLQELKTEESAMFKLMLDEEVCEFGDVDITFMSYAHIKRGGEPLLSTIQKTIMVSHVRGVLPPHVEEEYPIANFDDYDLTLLGDLHHYHKSLTGKNAWYPGSPYSTVFSQSAETNKYGVFIIDTDAESWEVPRFVQLHLPQLVTVRCAPSEIEGVKSRVGESMHCFKIEVEGSPEEMAKVKDKDVIKKSVVTSEATVDLNGKTRAEELEAVLEYMGVDRRGDIMRLYATIKT